LSSNDDENNRANDTTASPANETAISRSKDDKTIPAPVVSSHSPRLRLTVARSAGPGGNIVLRRAASIIGSRPGCKVLLKHNAVSGVHCAVINTGGEIYIRDLLSRNGTYLNDLRAEQEHLEDGDVITIRPWQLRVAVVVPKLDDSSDVTGLGLEPAPAVIALEEIGTKRVRQLTRELNLIGRRHGCDLVVEDRSVSRAHAIISTYLSRVVIFDLMSQNDTLVNGRAVTFSTLQSDDLLSLGTVDMRVKIVAPSPKARSSGNGQAVQPPDPEGSVSDRIDIRAAERDRR